MTPTKTRKAVTPPTNTKVEAKAPVVEKKFVPKFTPGTKEVKASVYQLLNGKKKPNGTMQWRIPACTCTLICVCESCTRELHTDGNVLEAHTQSQSCA